MMSAPLRLMPSVRPNLMSKHDTITDNLLALTRSRSFRKAVEGWSVSKLVTLSPQRAQACELCGTRFRTGAVVVHERSKATIVVGGTCLKTLQAHRFPQRFKFKQARHFTIATLTTHYGPLVDPGNWLLWIRGNAPRRLVQAAADLAMFGTVLHSDELGQLIKFHDNRRLFPRDVLLADPRTLEKALGISIPRHLTITKARQLLKKGSSTASARRHQVGLAAYMNSHVLPRVKDDPDLANLWPRLTPLDRRAVAALVALDGCAAANNTALMPPAMADRWPPPGRAPMFVWNPKTGLGFVAKDDVFDPPKAYVWLWRSGRYQKAIFNLDYWRGAVGCPPESVEQVEKLAFAGVFGIGSGLPTVLPGSFARPAGPSGRRT